MHWMGEIWIFNGSSWYLVTSADWLDQTDPLKSVSVKENVRSRCDQLESPNQDSQSRLLQFFIFCRNQYVELTIMCSKKTAADVKMEIPVLVWSLKSSILSSTSLQMDKMKSGECCCGEILVSSQHGCSGRREIRPLEADPRNPANQNRL